LIKKSAWLGALIAPLTAPIVYCLLVSLFVPDVTPKLERNLESTLIALFLIFIPTSYLLSYMLGLPLITFLGRIKKLRFKYVAVSSGCLGILALGLLTLLADRFLDVTIIWKTISFADAMIFIGIGFLLGSLIGVSFFLLSGMQLKNQSA
jgi:hypothetical protein